MMRTAAVDVVSGVIGTLMGKTGRTWPVVDLEFVRFAAWRAKRYDWHRIKSIFSNAAMAGSGCNAHARVRADLLNV